MSPSIPLTRMATSSLVSCFALGLRPSPALHLPGRVPPTFGEPQYPVHPENEGACPWTLVDRSVWLSFPATCYLLPSFSCAANMYRRHTLAALPGPDSVPHWTIICPLLWPALLLVAGPTIPRRGQGERKGRG